MRAYHDDEWGVPTHDDRRLFELLTLEGAQAGLSWSTILNKRARYREVFAGFDPAAVAGFGEAEIATLLDDPGIVRNRLKVRGTVTNARAVLAVQREHGSLDAFLWSWVDGRTLVNHPRTMAGVPARTERSDRLSKDLKRLGFTFVGSTIIYSFLQAAGMVDDHLETCPAKAGAPG
jgi:DNA-3-methyladenine glycosylase I